MITCDACNKAGLDGLRIGERSFAWCGSIECLPTFFTKIRELLVPVAKTVRITLEQQQASTASGDAKHG